jgi:hypothetical protein
VRGEKPVRRKESVQPVRRKEPLRGEESLQSLCRQPLRSVRRKRGKLFIGLRGAASPGGSEQSVRGQKSV